MKSITDWAGFPVTMDAAGNLDFGPGVAPAQRSVRRLEEMRGVLADPQAGGPEQLYVMYRGVAHAADRPRLEARGLRYDLTVLAPGLIGREFVKTAGHYHPAVPGTGVNYPEVYEVLHGVAHYLLQRMDPSGDSVEDAVLVEAYPGEKVLVPPGYGHITINPGPGRLAMSNLSEATFHSLYGPIREKGGGAYFELSEAEGPRFAANPRYQSVPPLRRARARAMPALGLRPDHPLYTLAVGEPERFAYLVEPHRHLELLEKEGGPA